MLSASAAASTSPTAPVASKSLRGGRATKEGNTLSGKDEPGLRSLSILPVRAPPVSIVISTGPVRVWRSPAGPTRSSVSGKAKLTQREGGQPADGDSAGTSASVVRGPPRGTKVIVMWLAPGSAANASVSRRTVTVSPGRAKGVVTSPSVDGKRRSAAGMTLHDASIRAGWRAASTASPART